MFISHDLHTVRSVCDEVMVLYAGRTVEAGSRASIGTAPWHPYAELLISSVPELRTGWLEKVDAAREGAVPTLDGTGQVSGSCAFFPRCRMRVPGTCDMTPVPVHRLSKGADVLCQHDEATLRVMQGST
jgi:peptide/nickel transport system ATP-binding protein